jgi:hypothetical protein
MRWVGYDKRCNWILVKKLERKTPLGRQVGGR